MPATAWASIAAGAQGASSDHLRSLERFVGLLLRTHSLLQPLRAGGVAVLLRCGASSISVRAVGRDGDACDIEARLQLVGAGDGPIAARWGIEIANRLASGLRLRWDAAGSD